MPVQDIYLAITVPSAAEYSEALGSFLFDLGAEGVLENEGSLTAYFRGDRRDVPEAIGRYLAELARLGHQLRPEEITCEEIVNRDWNSEWKKSYTGFAISDRIYIKPTWESRPPAEYACLIEIDPEMAFGTGTHATTRLCLRLLEERLQPGSRVLDIGTGTGILAIAAAKLGAGAIVAFDIDPVAAETAGRNAAANGVRDRIEVSAGLLADLPVQPFDLILANIQRSEIINMLPLLRQRFSVGTEFVFSGILREEETVFRAALDAEGFFALQMRYDEEWLACLAR
jgi:ribosomal protein L11 methyltransferase